MSSFGILPAFQRQSFCLPVDTTAVAQGLDHSNYQPEYLSKWIWFLMQTMAVVHVVSNIHGALGQNQPETKPW